MFKCIESILLGNPPSILVGAVCSCPLSLCTHLRLYSLPPQEKKNAHYQQADYRSSERIL